MSVCMSHMSCSFVVWVYPSCANRSNMQSLNSWNEISPFLFVSISFIKVSQYYSLLMSSPSVVLPFLRVERANACYNSLGVIIPSFWKSNTRNAAIKFSSVSRVTRFVAAVTNSSKSSYLSLFESRVFNTSRQFGSQPH